MIEGIRPASLPRMADFGRILAAMDSVLGTQAFDAYVGKGDDLAGEVIEGDEIGRAIQAFVWGLPDHRWSGRASDLLDELEPAGGARPSKYWPDSPRGLSARLKRLTPALESVGILVVQAKVNGVRRITLQAAEAKEPEIVAETEAEAKVETVEAPKYDIDDLIGLAA